MKRHNRTPFISAFALLAIAFFPSCSSTQEPWWNRLPTLDGHQAGTLIVAGGAVDARGQVLPRFFAEADRAARALGHEHTRVEIIPTASGDPARSLQHNWENFTKVAPSIEVGGLPLRETDGELAKDPAVIRRVESASALWFTGGDQSRIMALLDPGSGPSCEQPDPLHRDPHPLYSAAWDVQANGGLIGGSSAGAAIMSHPMITGGRSEGALLNGCGKGGVSTAPGMGYFPFGIVDQHFLARGRMGRLLVATGSHGLRYGFGVEENSAMVVTLGDRPMIEVLGAAGLCILDLGEDPEFLVDTDGDGIPQSHDEFPYPWKFEVTLLGTGDRWDPLSGKAIPNRTRKPLALPAASPVPSPSTLGLWDSGAIATAIHRLSLNPNAPQILKSENFQIQFSSGPGTRFLIHSSYSNDIFAERVQIHLSKREARQ